MKQNNYIDDRIFGIPKPLNKGHNTSPNKSRIGMEYIHKVKIKNNVYFKVQIKRQNVSKIKYFKQLKEAKLFVMMLRENKYL